MVEPLVVLVVLLAVAGGFAGTHWHFSRGRALLEQWAESGGYTLVSSQYCWMWRGPFWLRSSKRNAVYRVTVRDDRGGTRSGHVRCGSYFAGMLSSDVVVLWDD